MAAENPYESPPDCEPPSRDEEPRNLFSFSLALELLVLAAILVTLISLLL